MFKMLKVMDFVTLIIAVTALIISIVCMNKKCDNFGDTACGVPGNAKEGNNCFLDSNDIRARGPNKDCKSNEIKNKICGKDLRCKLNLENPKEITKCIKGNDEEVCDGYSIFGKPLCPK